MSFGDWFISLSITAPRFMHVGANVRRPQAVSLPPTEDAASAPSPKDQKVLTYRRENSSKFPTLADTRPERKMREMEKLLH